jgi:hypothetical protein
VKALIWLILVACSNGVTATSVATPTADIPPEEVADEIAAALDGGDPSVVAAFTDLRPMPWVALAEGATVEEAASLEAGENSLAVADNFWTGFLASAGLAGDEVADIEAFTEGSTDFARLELRSGSIILNQSDVWRIDVIASFAAPLAERLLGAVEVIVANRSAEADVLREMLRGERDAVAVASADPSITTSARTAVEEVLAAIDSIDG